MQDAGFWVDVAFKGWTVVLTFYIAVNKGFYHVKSKIETLEKDLNGVGSRLNRLESKVCDGPNHAHLGDLHEKINQVQKSVSEQSGRLGAVETMLHTIHNHLMNKP